MKLLLDQNLSPRLVDVIAEFFPGSAHVSGFNLQTADDRQVWDYSASHGFTIVSKDFDFHQMSFVLGHPPKVIWIQRGNCSTSDVAQLLVANAETIRAFGRDQEAGFLALW